VSKIRGSATAYPVTPAELVIEHHMRLQDQHAHPSDARKQWLRNYFADVEEKAKYRAREHWQTLFQREAYPMRDHQDAPLLCGILARGLFNARTYQVTAEMSDAVSAMYVNTAQRLQHIPAEYQPPAECGFVWLDKPWVHKDRYEKTTSTRVITWQPQTMTTTEPVTNGFGQKVGEREVFSDGWRISVWSIVGDPDDYRDAEMDAYYTEHGPLLLLHTWVFEREIRFGGRSHEKMDDIMAWVWCLWLMLDSEVVAYKRDSQIGRPVAAFRRAQKKLRFSQVNVVLLRRAKSTGLDDHDYSTRETDWSHRWLQAGHYRHLNGRQDHHAIPAHHGEGSDLNCQGCGGRITWVKACVKGPEHLPLVERPQLHRLSR
jgi:hypothetical protein